MCGRCGINELALFAGVGGGILAGQELGWRTICAVERDAYAAAVLAQRQNDEVLEAFPIWSDIETFDGKPWRGIVDVISGGFPCQDISSAGKGEGITGDRSGLWKEMHRIICEVRPRFVFVENSPMLASRGLGVVLGDLAEAGYDCKWTCLSAAEVGAPHKRERIWIVGDSNSHGKSISAKHDEAQGVQELVANANSSHGKGDQRTKRSQPKPAEHVEHCGWEIEPAVGRVANGVANRLDRLKAIGNGQVPQCAAEAWRLLTG